MERYDRLYRLYAEFDTETLRAYQDLVDLFPPVDSRVALDQWQAASEELQRRRGAIAEAFPGGEALAAVAARATREQAFAALDLHARHGRGVNALVLDVDETLRSAGNTDNEIPRETLHLLTELHDSGVHLVVCTGQTLENVKGFLVQGLGSELVHSGRTSVVYEAGTGVFTLGRGAGAKQLLYEDLDPAVRAVFDSVRSRVLSAAPDDLRRRCHLQGNEFNVTLKPNAETGSEAARAVIRRALVHLLDLLGTAVRERVDLDPPAADATAGSWARAHYAARDPEVEAALDAAGALPDGAADPPGAAADLFGRVDVGYYAGDAAEITSRELTKVAGVEAAFDALGVGDPFALVMGDSRSDLRVMEWADERGAGIAAAPGHASEAVVEHVRRTDGIVFRRGDAAAPLRVVYALDRLAALGE